MSKKHEAGLSVLVVAALLLILAGLALVKGATPEDYVSSIREAGL